VVLKNQATNFQGKTSLIEEIAKAVLPENHTLYVSACK